MIGGEVRDPLRHVLRAGHRHLAQFFGLGIVEHRHVRIAQTVAAEEPVDDVGIVPVVGPHRELLVAGLVLVADRRAVEGGDLAVDADGLQLRPAPLRSGGGSSLSLWVQSVTFSGLPSLARTPSAPIFQPASSSSALERAGS